MIPYLQAKLCADGFFALVFCIVNGDLCLRYNHWCNPGLLEYLSAFPPLYAMKVFNITHNVWTEMQLVYAFTFFIFRYKCMQCIFIRDISAVGIVLCCYLYVYFISRIKKACYAWFPILIVEFYGMRELPKLNCLYNKNNIYILHHNTTTTYTIKCHKCEHGKYAFRLYLKLLLSVVTAEITCMATCAFLLT